MEHDGQPRTDPVQVLMGAGAVFLGHAILVLCAMLSSLVFGVGLEGLIFVIGAAQGLYVVPFLLWTWRAQRKGPFWGALAAASLTALLNGGCWGFVYQNLSGI